MKNSFLIFVILLSSSFILSQENTKTIENKEVNEITLSNDNKWVAGVNLLSFGNYAGIGDSYKSNGIKLGNGFTVKREFNSFALRFGAEYIYIKNISDDNDQIVQSREEDRTEFLLKFGIEKSLYTYKFATLYSALDLYGSIGATDYESYDYGTGISQNVRHKRNAIGILPVIGLEFKLVNDFYLNTEIRYNISKSYIESIIDSQLDPSANSVSNDSGYFLGFSSGFAIVSLNYKF